MLPQVLKGWSLNDTRYDNVTTLLKKNCKRNITDDGSYFPLGGGDGILTNLPQKSMREDVTYEKYECGYLFANWGIGDLWTGRQTSSGLIRYFCHLIELQFFNGTIYWSDYFVLVQTLPR